MTHDSSDTGTIVHLPECKALDTMPEATRMFYSTSRQWFWEHGCICDRLRACEQRVREGWYEIQSETWEQGYKYALDAAREAVAALRPKQDGWHPDGDAVLRLALAAIDALVRDDLANSQEPAYKTDGERQNSDSQRNDYRNDSHLPECPTAWMRDCICNELRMCEERVLRDMDSVYGEGFQAGRQAMLTHFTHRDAEIVRLTRLWYEAVSRDYHKDRDCHWYITTKYSYGEQPTFAGSHPGYIGPRWVGEERTTYAEALADLRLQLLLAIEAEVSWAKEALANPESWSHDRAQILIEVLGGVDTSVIPSTSPNNPKPR